MFNTSVPSIFKPQQNQQTQQQNQNRQSIPIQNLAPASINTNLNYNTTTNQQDLPRIYITHLASIREYRIDHLGKVPIYAEPFDFKIIGDKLIVDARRHAFVAFQNDDGSFDVYLVVKKLRKANDAFARFLAQVSPNGKDFIELGYRVVP